MVVTDLISFDQIRAVLTVSQTDLPDKTLQDYGLSDDLLYELSSWYPNFVDETNELVIAKLRMFSKYFCGSEVARTSPIFVLNRITVGDKTSERSSADYTYLHDTLKSKALAIKAKIIEEVGLATSSYEELVFVGVSKPYRDVITKERQ